MMAADKAPPRSEDHSATDKPTIDTEDLLRRSGLRVTPQRLLILDAFGAGEHVTADEIYERVAQQSPAINRSTVYRTLDMLRDLELISDTDLGGGVRRYELLGSPRHHHLVCLDCGHVMTLDDDVVEPLRAAVQARYDFEPQFDHLALYGHCADCRAAGRASDHSGGT